MLIRVDLNVPMENGKVTDMTRIERVAPTIAELADKGAKVVVLSHFGRPGGKVVPEMSLKALVAPLARDARSTPRRLRRGLRRCPWRSRSSPRSRTATSRCWRICASTRRRRRTRPAFVDQLSVLGDIYVNDAFSCAHRAHASTEGLANRLPAVAGRLMQAELEALDKALGKPEAAGGGAHRRRQGVDQAGRCWAISSARVDRLVIGGGMANTFLHAQGIAVGKSLCEKDLAGTAREILAKAAAANCKVLLPVDAVIAAEFKPGAASRTVDIAAVPDDQMILDIGPTIDRSR